MLCLLTSFALQDPKTYMLLLICLGGSLPNAAITSFASIIIKTFGYSTLGTQYMQIPGGAIQFVGPLIGGYLCTHYSGRLPIRTIVMAIGNVLALTGAAMLVGLPSSSKWGRLVGLWLCYFQSVGFSLSFTVISSNMAGYTKKSVTASAYFTMYCVGNIVSPQTFRTSEAPGYHTAYIV
jgi:MFS family permease